MGRKWRASMTDPLGLFGPVSMRESVVVEPRAEPEGGAELREAKWEVTPFPGSDELGSQLIRGDWRIVRGGESTVGRELRQQSVKRQEWGGNAPELSPICSAARGCDSKLGAHQKE